MMHHANGHVCVRVLRLEDALREKTGKLMHHTGGNAVLTVQADASLRVRHEKRQVS